MLPLLPPLVALAVALATRRVLLALATAAWTGFLLLEHAHGTAWLSLPWRATLDLVHDGLLGQVAQPSQAQVLLLIGLIGAFVHLLEHSGAGRATMDRAARGLTAARPAELAAWAAGVGFFFSDLGNVLLLGPMFRGVFDCLGLPRERLAWIIDTTAAPVSVLIPVVAWGVYIIGLVEGAFRGADPAAVDAVLPGRWRPDAGTVDGLAVFFDVLPLQLYAWLSLLFVPLLVALGRPYGAMARARPADPTPPDAATEGPSAWPGALSVAALFATLVAVGGWSWAQEGRLAGEAVRTTLAAGYLAATGTLAALLAREGRPVAVATLQAGAARSVGIAVILLLAWSLGHACAELGTGAALAALLGDRVPPGLLPAAVFVVGAATSFATGTSWGTFAVLIPVVVPLGLQLGLPAPLLLAAVLSGGVFGDHCSPISDTTILASMGAGCDHADHVATQLPYALTVGGAALAGFAAAGLVGPAAGHLTGVALVVAAVAASRLRARAPASPAASPAPRAPRTP
ncbi:MAG: Na+/H+ antiporter NhaC family protein [Myxococcota bacterium]